MIYMYVSIIVRVFAGLEQVICGNPVRALRRRKKQTSTLSSQSSVTFSPSHEQDLLARVHSWRLE